VKDVLQLIKKAWLKDDLLDHVKSTNTIDFVLSLKDRTRTFVEIANDMEEKAKSKNKFWYDRKSRDVLYEVGEQVFLLLPLIGKPLQSKYCEPYTVVKWLCEVDYLISTSDRRKAKRVLHVNLVRKFIV